MAKIILYPAKVLRRKAKVINKIDNKVLEEIDRLVDTLKNKGDGAGLAAPQIGISKRMIAVMDRKTRQVKVFINPKIVGVWGIKDYLKITAEDEGEEDFLEGCLSFPHLFGTVKRYFKVKVSWQEMVNEKLLTIEKEFEGFEAVVFQHEIDHLDGIVFVDHIKRDGGKFFKLNKGKLVEWDIDKILG